MTPLPTHAQRLYGGVYMLDHPCPANAARIDTNALPLLAEMNATGLRADRSAFASLAVEIRERMREPLAELEKIAGYPVNPKSSPQVSKLLFDQLKVQGDREVARSFKTSQASTDSKYLTMYADRHPAVQLVLDYRELGTLLSTFVTPLPRLIDDDGRIRTRFKHTATSTGRYASEEPNLQNIPTRSKLGKRIRDCFVASPGHVLVGCDLSQIEMVWAAHLSQDPTLLHVFQHGLDMHTLTACKIWGIPYDPKLKEDPDFSKNRRVPAKTLGFGVLYLITPQGLQIRIVNAGGPEWPVERCEAYIAQWYDTYPGVRSFQETQFSRARRYECVWSAFGRPRLIPEVRSSLNRVKEAGLRQCANQPIQSSAGETLKICSARLANTLADLRKLKMKVRACLTIHDELVVEVEQGAGEEMGEIMRDIMETTIQLDVPIKSDAKIGERWGDIK